MDPNNPPPSAGQAPNQGGVSPVPTQQSSEPFDPAQGKPVVPPVQNAAPGIQTDQSQAAQPVAQSAVQSAEPSVSPVAPADLPPPPIYTPVSSAQGKEFAPAPIHSESMRPSEVEPTLHPEVKKAGVEKVSEVPNLTLEDQKAGIELAKETTPVPAQNSLGITLPIPSGQAVVIAKKGNVKDSIAWLATLILRQLKIVRMNKKESHV